MKQTVLSCVRYKIYHWNPHIQNSFCSTNCRMILNAFGSPFLKRTLLAFSWKIAKSLTMRSVTASQDRGFALKMTLKEVDLEVFF